MLDLTRYIRERVTIMRVMNKVKKKNRAFPCKESLILAFDINYDFKLKS